MYCAALAYLATAAESDQVHPCISQHRVRSLQNPTNLYETSTVEPIYGASEEM
jgi:hypothetical protein